jgi:predicted  nucleic acid-binding Zn-ribbon protein
MGTMREVTLEAELEVAHRLISELEAENARLQADHTDSEKALIDSLNAANERCITYREEREAARDHAEALSKKLAEAHATGGTLRDSFEMCSEAPRRCNSN